MLQGLEVGTCRIAGHLPALEQAAVSRQAGQHQPDSLAAVIVAHDVLVHAAGARVTIATRLAASLGDGTRRLAIHADHRP